MSIVEHDSKGILSRVRKTHMSLPSSFPHLGSRKKSRMRTFLVRVILLLSLVNHGTDLAMAWDDKDFFTFCPPTQCSKNGPEIRYPFWLESSNTSSSCGTPCLKLSCSGQDTILAHPVLGPCKVTAIDYSRGYMSIIPHVDSSFSGCPLQRLISGTIPSDSDRSFKRGDCDTYFQSYGTLVWCSREFTPIIDAANSISGPFSCLSNTTHFVYLVHTDESMSVLPLDCKAVSDGIIPIPFYYNSIFVSDYHFLPFKETIERIHNSAESTLGFDYGYDVNSTYVCHTCESRCAFSSQRNKTFCMPNPHGSRIKVIAATSSVAAFVLLLLTVAVVLYISLKTTYNEAIHLKVEMFLKTNGTSKPMRYTFSEVKKIARRFKEKIGQGGFGSVYKGELSNGVPVAVKMLENTIGEGEEFINDVATIGPIHHANIVRLLGFCSEGTRRALIYEYMPNESLEKHIFQHDTSISRQLLVPGKMLDIALGIARGMEYLHQGCNQRILHFDIKPYNILLDYNFNPKISDFGLAKLCARDQSIITLTAARGTMGYIAPEIYSRNFGGVSYKSDVYSFGMLVLEKVSGRRNSDPGVETQDEVYLPEWIYEKVITGQEFVLPTDITEAGEETVRKLAIVALWCIQWSPKDRPSMTKVVNMLTGNLQNIQMPPKPFVSSASHPVKQESMSPGSLCK